MILTAVFNKFTILAVLCMVVVLIAVYFIVKKRYEEKERDRRRNIDATMILEKGSKPFTRNHLVEKTQLDPDKVDLTQKTNLPDNLTDEQKEMIAGYYKSIK